MRDFEDYPQVELKISSIGIPRSLTNVSSKKRDEADSSFLI